MSVALAEPVARPAAERPRPALTLVPQEAAPATAPTRPRPRRSGPGVGPAARPRRLRFTAPARPAVTSCRVPEPVVVAPQPGAWRLTERGLTVVLVLAAALVVSGVAVVALTALRVTGESYHPGAGAAAPMVVAQP